MISTRETPGLQFDGRTRDWSQNQGHHDGHDSHSPFQCTFCPDRLRCPGTSSGRVAASIECVSRRAAGALFVTKYRAHESLGIFRFHGRQRRRLCANAAPPSPRPPALVAGSARRQNGDVPVPRSACQRSAACARGRKELPMQKDEQGVWTAVTDPLEPDLLRLFLRG